MEKPERLQALIKRYEYLVENDFMIPKGIGIGKGMLSKERLPPQYEEKITTGMYAAKRPMMYLTKFDILEGEYLPTGEQLNATREAIDLLNQIKALRGELGIEATPLKGETELLSIIEEQKVTSTRVILPESVKKLIEEVGRETSRNEALQAVTNPQREENEQGQSHNDE